MKVDQEHFLRGICTPRVVSAARVVPPVPFGTTKCMNNLTSKLAGFPFCSNVFATKMRHAQLHPRSRQAHLRT